MQIRDNHAISLAIGTKILRISIENCSIIIPFLGNLLSAILGGTKYVDGYVDKTSR